MTWIRYTGPFLDNLFNYLIDDIIQMKLPVYTWGKLMKLQRRQFSRHCEINGFISHALTGILKFFPWVNNRTMVSA